MIRAKSSESEASVPLPDFGLIEALGQAYNHLRMVKLQRHLEAQLEQALECLRGADRLELDAEAQLHLKAHLPVLETEYPAGPNGPTKAQLILGLAAYFACCIQAPKITIAHLAQALTAWTQIEEHGVAHTLGGDKGDKPQNLSCAADRSTEGPGR